MRGKSRTTNAGNKSSNHGTAREPTKAEKVLALLRRPRGATIAELSTATGWQEHSVRGFISGTLKKRRGLDVVSEKKDRAARRYRLGGGGGSHGAV
jgi:hypothetical protein